MIASRSRVPVVPVRLIGVNRVLPPNVWMVHPGPVEVRFGAPMDLRGDDLPTLRAKSARRCARYDAAEWRKAQRCARTVSSRSGRTPQGRHQSAHRALQQVMTAPPEAPIRPREMSS